MTATLRTLGIFIALVGIWGALVPYVGPLFGYPMPPGGATVSAWEWTASHWQLHLVPGLIAIVGGLLMTARRAIPGSLLALIGGAWFIVGNDFADVWQSGGMGGMGGAANVSEWMTVATVLGYHDGTGLALVIPAAIALGIAAARRGERHQPVHRHEPVREPVGAVRR